MGGASDSASDSGSGAISISTPLLNDKRTLDHASSMEHEVTALRARADHTVRHRMPENAAWR